MLKWLSIRKILQYRLIDEPKKGFHKKNPKKYLSNELSMSINTWKWLMEMHYNNKVKVYNICRNEIHRKLRPPSAVMATEYFGTLKEKLHLPPMVLIPRMDTFFWLQRIHSLKGSILEIGSGTGAMAFQLEIQCPLSTIYSSETSAKAFKCAIKNSLLQRSKVQFIRDDFITSPLQKGKEFISAKKIQTIISNPPYIRRLDYISKVAPSVRRWEPRMALIGDGKDGIGFHRRILRLISFIVPGANSIRGAIEFDGSMLQRRLLVEEYHALFGGSPSFIGNRCMVIR